MASVWRVMVFWALLAGCLCDDQPANLRLDSVQVPTDPSIQWWPWKTKTTTKRTTTTHSTTQQTNHTTIPSTTAQINHTTTPATTAQTNHTTTPATTAQINLTTTPATTAQTNHTTTPATTSQTNHTTTPATTAQTNHTTTPATTAQTNHTTMPVTTAQTNHTTMVSTTAHANHTTAPQPTSPPPPPEYFVNSTSGVCLRIKANFVITLNITKIINVTIPNGPETKASGNCSDDVAELTLKFPNGKLTLTFRQNKTEKKFSLGAVHITVLEKDPSEFSNSSLEDMSTPMGRSFACKEVVVKLSPAVTFVLSDVHVQAFDVPGGNYGKEYNCSKSPTNNTVPIVVGIVLLVLIVIVVLVYIIARQRKHREGYQTL
ncbi:macrosialin [Hyperolius riggenbachi]|uniref:macrosialin n=1 Tax=Hyperolius riggenbachi TaxID=752182 RepID=UPI0035A30868